MRRFELTGSGISDGQDPDKLLTAAKKFGLHNPRLAYHGGLSNQPQTIRFSAVDWETAERLVEPLRAHFYPEYAEGRLCPMIRPYPVDML